LREERVGIGELDGWRELQAARYGGSWHELWQKIFLGVRCTK
jgi:hypothetical protein